MCRCIVAQFERHIVLEFFNYRFKMKYILAAILLVSSVFGSLIDNGMEETDNETFSAMEQTEYEILVEQFKNRNYEIIYGSGNNENLTKTTAPSASSSVNNIKAIPGADLYTGVYYRIGMKRFPRGVLTWTNAKTQHGGNYVQIDLNPDNLPYYAPGEKWDRDAQWILTETEREGWYNLKNRAVQDGITTWSYEEVGGGNHIILSRKPEDVLAMTSPDGKWRNDSFWKPIETAESKEGGYYKLALASFPQGAITWTGKKYGDYSHYIQVDKKPDNQIHYAPENKWYNDSLFKFSLAELELNGVISHFEYPHLNLSVSIENTTTVKYTVPNPSPLPVTSSIENTFSKSNTLKLEFKQGMDIFNNVKISANMPETLGKIVYILNRSGHAQSQSSVVLDDTTQEYNINKQVNVPPYTSMEINAYYKWAELEQVPFKAILEIDGVVGQFTVPPAQISQALLESGFEYELSNVERNKFVILVTGNMSASIGLGAEVVTKQIPISSTTIHSFKRQTDEKCICDSNFVKPRKPNISH